MASMTLLEMVQGILAEIDGDTVSSISDTVEATDVASTIRQLFYDIVDEHELAHHEDLINLESVGDVARPNLLKIPAAVSKIEWIKYDVRLTAGANKAYREMKHRDPLDFVEFVNSRPSTDTTNYVVVNYATNTPLVIAKLSGPTYWTSFDDDYIVFDAYDSAIDSTLQASKSLAMGRTRPTLSLTDTAVPDLPEGMQRLLYNTALAESFAHRKRYINPRAERKENRFRVRSQRNKWRQGRVINMGPNFGRK